MEHHRYEVSTSYRTWVIFLKKNIKDRSEPHKNPLLWYGWWYVMYLTWSCLIWPTAERSGVLWATGQCIKRSKDTSCSSEDMVQKNIWNSVWFRFALIFMGSFEETVHECVVYYGLEERGRVVTYRREKSGENEDISSVFQRCTRRRSG